MYPSTDYLKPVEPPRPRMYADETMRADGTARNPEYRAGAGWILALLAIAALLTFVFTFPTNESETETYIAPATSVSSTPADANSSTARQ